MRTPQELGREHISSLSGRSPRLAGLALFLLGLILSGANVVLMYFAGRFVAKLFIVGFPVSGVGLWILLTGRVSRTEGRPTPLWWTVGALLCTGLGIVMGIYLSTRLGR